VILLLSLTAMTTKQLDPEPAKLKTTTIKPATTKSVTMTEKGRERRRKSGYWQAEDAGTILDPSFEVSQSLGINGDLLSSTTASELFIPSVES
jgi:hypothetical protein